MKYLLLLNGDQPSKNLLLSKIRTHDLLVVADGALSTCHAYDVVPNIICGDFDSIKSKELLKKFTRSEIVHDPSQYSTDFEKCLAQIREYTQNIPSEKSSEKSSEQHSISILGCFGGRVDHFLTNISLILKWSKIFKINAFDDRSSLDIVRAQKNNPGILSLETTKNDIISLVTFSNEIFVSVQGVKWELNREKVSKGAFGLSNIALGDKVEIIVEVEKEIEDEIIVISTKK